MRNRLGLSADHCLAVGIERFDYTKGILDRMRAVDVLLETRPEWRGRFSFVQVAAPTRDSRRLRGPVLPRASTARYRRRRSRQIM